MPELPISLRLQHFMTPAAHAHRNLLAPWAARIAAASEGRLEVDLFTGMELGGRPDELYDQSRDGFLDLAWMLPSYNPGRFLKSEVFELPFVAAASAEATSRAFHEFVETHAADEFAEVKPIFFWTHDFGVLCLNRPVRSLGDLIGRKVRYLTRAQKEILSNLGMIPQRMGIYPAVEAFSRGELDGLILPWEGVRSFGAMPFSTHYVEFDFTPTLYTQTHMLTMNRARYEALPGDLRAVIDASSGIAAAGAAGSAWDSEAALVRRIAREEGAEFFELDGDQIRDVRERSRGMMRYWLDEMAARGLDGGSYLERATDLVERHRAAGN